MTLLLLAIFAASPKPKPCAEGLVPHRGYCWRLAPADARTPPCDPAWAEEVRGQCHYWVPRPGEVRVPNS